MEVSTSSVTRDLDWYLERMGTDTDGRYDVTPLFADPELFARLRTDLLGDATEVTHVVGSDALGFALGGAVATDRGLGFVPVRKGGKLPYPDERLHRRCFTDSSGDTTCLELRRGALGSGDRALVVDDWVETGAQMLAATALVEDSGAAVSGVAALSVEAGAGHGLHEQYPVSSLD